ncbi:CHASE3 domain-containing protein [Pedobacter sp. NJ-S-72]
MFKLTFKQQVLTGFIISLLFVLLSAITSTISIRKTNEDAKWENHTYDVIDVAQDIELKLLNSETSLRGYIITQRNEYLDTYTKNIHQIIPKVKEMQRMTADNPDQQQQRMDSLELYSAQKVKDMEDILQTNNTTGKDAAVQMVLTDKGRAMKMNMLRLNNDAIKAEKGLLSVRTENRINSAQQSTITVVVSAIIIFGLILYLFSFIKRTFDEQKLTEITIRENNNQLETLSEQNKQKNWLLSGASMINESMRGEQETDELSTHIITELCTYLSASVGALYLFNPKRQTLQLSGGYAYPEKKGRIKEITIGEGMVGQVALEKRIKQLNDVPADYLKISSGLGNTTPNTIVVLPVLFEEETIAVIELGLLAEPTEIINLFLSTITESIGVGINSAVARAQLRDLFMQTQQQAEELESQQEELRTTNEELIHKSEELQASEEELRVQQEELRQTNAELEEKASLLEERNISVNEAREAMSLKAEELEVSSKYKSEFLANMSHELRTPLNSILILARILKENRPENLNDEQLKYAGVIHNAGSDLLTLINDILDLSKIESGKVDLDIEPVRPQEVKQNMESLFNEIAKSKKINYEVTLGTDLPERMMTDLSRAEQIIKKPFIKRLQVHT